MIWQKAFVRARERFDGTDVAQLIRASGDLLGYIDPGERTRVPLSPAASSAR